MTNNNGNISAIRGGKSKQNPDNLAERAYLQIKQDIFDFRLLPGDRFTESEVATRVQASRTPVREALYRLQREGYVDVHYRAGWQIKPFDFRFFEEMYDIRIILEIEAIHKLCDLQTHPPMIDELCQIWLVPENERLSDPFTVSVLDERFHEILVEAAGNKEMSRIHHDITERLRIIRRLDFDYERRIQATYKEHADILRTIVKRRNDQARMLLKSHIQESRSEVRKITLHKMHQTRNQIDSRVMSHQYDKN